jgi:polygalacturonase
MTYNIADYGAVPDGTNVAKAIQAAIDDCGASGGGTVLVPPGDYICSTVHLGSNITIELSSGATLAFSREDDFEEPEELDYNPDADFETTLFRWALFTGENISNIAIVGRGAIDGSPFKRGGPKPIALKSCSNVTIRDITIRNAPSYNISLIDCENANIDGVSIFNGLADGIDLDNCRYCRVQNCYIDAYDDGVCLKTSPALGRKSETTNIAVTNCCIMTSCYALKMGTESTGDCKNVAFSNCVLHPRKGHGEYLGGIALEAVDGAHLDGFTISNITMDSPRCAIFLRVGNRGRGQDPHVPGSLENVVISSINAKNVSLPILVTGIPERSVEHVVLSDIIIEYCAAKSESLEKADLDVPECIATYPDAGMFGPLPAWGVYCRHASDIALKDIHLYQATADPRLGIVLDDAHHADVDCSLSWKQGEQGEGSEATGAPAAWINQSTLVSVRAGGISGIEPAFRVTGSQTREVVLSVEQPRSRAPSLDTGDDVEQSEIFLK